MYKEYNVMKEENFFFFAEMHTKVVTLLPKPLLMGY